MSMGRCIKHGCAYSVELVDGQRREYCPECEVEALRAQLTRLRDAFQWQPIETAPTDGSLLLVYAPGREGLPAMQSLCRWHPDAGFCIDELREPTHWMPLPSPPLTGATED